MDLWEQFGRVGLALGLGLLVGLQRERAESQLAGIRTFPLITAFGAVCALLIPAAGPWTVGAGALAIAAMLVVGNVAKLRAGDADPGLTTEAAALVMYALGAYCVVGRPELALALGGVVVLLLHLREPLHGFVRRIGARDLSAIMQFVLIALVVLPVLPDKAYGPFSVINPRKVWMMVVLIVGISLGGYVAYKLFGARAGALLGGVLGGLISSTATSVSYARRTAAAPEAAPLAAVVIMIASTVAFARMIIWIAVAAPSALGVMAPPLGAMFGVMAALAAAAYVLGGVHGKRAAADLPEPGNPAELKSALVFGALYAVIVLAVAAARHYFGSRGLYVVAVISGLTDMDAITLSTSTLVQSARLAADVGWRLILLASLANNVFKAATVATLGHRNLTVRVATMFGLSLVAGAVTLFAWPAGWRW